MSALNVSVLYNKLCTLPHLDLHCTYVQFIYYKQWPVKYRMLVTNHGCTGEGTNWGMLTFENYWTFGAVFQAMTRAMVPPPPVATDLSKIEGAMGIRLRNDAKGRFYDPTFLALGLHPKVAVRFHDEYGKKIPADRLRKAREWLDEHNAFHLKQETMELMRVQATMKCAASKEAGGSSGEYDG